MEIFRTLNGVLDVLVIIFIPGTTPLMILDLGAHLCFGRFIRAIQ